MKFMFKKATAQKIIGMIALMLVAALSIGVLSPLTSNPEKRAEAINTLDNQKMDAMLLTSGVTAASFLVSALPDDTGTSLADELDSMSGILLLIVCIIYVEKFLLTATGLVSFSYLIPIACVLFMASLPWTEKQLLLRSWAIKILLFALLLFFMVPAGVTLTDMINETFHDSIEMSLNEVSLLATEAVTSEKENSNIFKQFIEGITDSIQLMYTTAKNMLSALIDAVAVLLVTSCIIPLLTMVIFLWGFKKLFGIEIRIKLPQRMFHPRGYAQSLTQKDTPQKIEQPE